MDRPSRGYPDAAALGFAGDEDAGWVALTRGGPIHFRLLRTLEDLAHAERLQKAVFAVTERDLIPANELIVVEETGGAVIGAFLPDDPDHVLGCLVGWGGFRERPRIVSDFMAVLSAARNLGLAEAMKRLQAAIALSRGFEEIVWTVDPLRAANARLNFGKLGAIARGYEIDRYGSGFAAGLYGGMPTDRIHVNWEIATPRVHHVLTGGGKVATVSPPGGIVPFAAGTPSRMVSIAIPADIDALVASAPDEALAWRMRVREALMAAFAEGFTIVGFIPSAEPASPVLILKRGEPLPSGCSSLSCEE